MAAKDWRRAGDDGPKAPRCDQQDPRRHPATSAVVLADGDQLTALGLARAPKRWRRLAALKDHQNLAEFTITHSRARGADDGGRRRCDASYGWRATAIGGRNKGIGYALPKLLYKSSISNERLRVSNWIVQRLYYYAVK